MGCDITCDVRRETHNIADGADRGYIADAANGADAAASIGCDEMLLKFGGNRFGDRFDSIR